MWERLRRELTLRKELILNMRMKHQLGLFQPFITYRNMKVTHMDDVGFRIIYNGVTEFITWTDYESY